MKLVLSTKYLFAMPCIGSTNIWVDCMVSIFHNVGWEEVCMSEVKSGLSLCIMIEFRSLVHALHSYSVGFHEISCHKCGSVELLLEHKVCLFCSGFFFFLGGGGVNHQELDYYDFLIFLVIKELDAICAFDC